VADTGLAQNNGMHDHVRNTHWQMPGVSQRHHMYVQQRSNTYWPASGSSSKYCTWRHSCEPSLENAPSHIPDLQYGTHCHQTFGLQVALPCPKNYSKRSFFKQHFPPADFY